MKRFIVLTVLFVALSFNVFAGDTRAIIKDGNATGFKGDALFVDVHNSARTVDWETAIQLAGETRAISDYISDLDIATPKYYQIVVPAGVTITVGGFFQTLNGAARILVSADDTVGAAGVTMTAIYNPNFTKVKTTTIKFYEDSNTTNAKATYYDIGLSGASTSDNPVGGASGSGAILKRVYTFGAGTYIIKLLSLKDNTSGTLFLNYHLED